MPDRNDSLVLGAQKDAAEDVAARPMQKHAVCLLSSDAVGAAKGPWCHCNSTTMCITIGS